MAFYKRITIFATMVTAVVAAGFATANAMNAGEPYWFAQRYYVRYIVGQATEKIERSQLQLKKSQGRLEMQMLASRIESVKAKISDRELLLNKQEGPEEYRRLVSQQVESFKEQLARLSEQMKTLRNTIVENNN